MSYGSTQSNDPRSLNATKEIYGQTITEHVPEDTTEATWSRSGILSSNFRAHGFMRNMITPTKKMIT
jgi:hypothetical protein